MWFHQRAQLAPRHRRLDLAPRKWANRELRKSAPLYWGPSYARTEIKDVLDNVKVRYTLQNTREKKFDSAVRLLRAG
jgi:hypothetical protein